MSTTPITDEIRALHHDLRGVAAAAANESDQQASNQGAGSAGEIERALQELKRCFEEIADDAEDLVTEHPMASLAAAFVLGVVVGRIAGAIK